MASPSIPFHPLASPLVAALVLCGATQAQAPAPRLPVAVYAILDHRVDSGMARRLTGWMVGAFHRDTSLLIVDRTGKDRRRGPQPVYAVTADLDRAQTKAPRLTIRVVDIRSVNLVAVSTVAGTMDSLQRSLPALADGLGRRLRVLYALRSPDRPPPHWEVPTQALETYSQALSALAKGDTLGARVLLRETLKAAPKFIDACDTLRRLGVNSC